MKTADKKNGRSTLKDYWRDNWKTGILVLLSFALFFFLMRYHLLHSALWGDELYEYNVGMVSIKNGEMYRVVTETFQPPLYNVIMHFWLKIKPDNLLWFRLFNVVIGMIAGVYLFLTQLELFKNRLVGCASLIVLGFCYYWIYAIQECSEYALMLVALFAAIYYYTRYKNTKKLRYEILFIGGCIAAMYSQYGAVFVIGPLLAIHLIDRFLSEKELKPKIRTCVLYLISLLVFALPLYHYFLKIQLANNQIADYAGGFSLKDIPGIITQLGLNIGYLWNLNRFGPVKMILSYLWIPFLAAVLVIAFRKYKGSALFPLALTLLTGYVLHYFLVVMKIYAMLGPNSSSGFFTRYSYFYIPVLAVVIPAGIYVIAQQFPAGAALKKTAAGAALLVLCIVCWPAIQKNWHKAYDDYYAKAWMERKGYEETTYLIGGSCEAAFDWYVSRAYGWEYKKNIVIDAGEIDYQNLPSAFWVWRTNWGGTEYDEILEEAEKQGYEAEVIYENEVLYDNGSTNTNGLVRFSLPGV